MYNANYYKMLNVAPDANEDEIKSAYLKLQQMHNPAYGGNQAVYEKILEAYSVISNVEQRVQYDKWYAEKYGKKEDNNVVYPIRIINFKRNTERTVNTQIDTEVFPPEKYCENGLYYAIEKDSDIYVCTKKQLESAMLYMVGGLKTNVQPPMQYKNSSETVWKVIRGVILAVIITVVAKGCGEQAAINDLESYKRNSFNKSGMKFTPDPIPTPFRFSPEELENIRKSIENMEKNKNN